VNPRFALLVGTFGLLSVIGSEAAEAGGRRAWFGGGGGVRVHARGSFGVHWSSPPRPTWRPRASWSIGGSIYVGTPAPRYRYYRPYYYTEAYVPSYYGESYYPVAPAAAPGYVVAVATRPELPKFGIGLFAGGSSVEDVNESSDLGVVGRLRLGQGGLLLEGELGKTSYQSDLRVDRRLGASLVYEIGARNRLAPYILGGFGVQQADVAGTYNTTQNFAELGIGLRYAITAKFHIAADVRAGSRGTMSSDDPSREPLMGTVARTVAPPSSSSNQSEEYTRARLSALLYF
jgi:hypothetical protein